MEIYTVALFGHREIYNFTEIENKLENIVKSLLQTKEYVDFIIGKNGDFDRIASSTIRRCQRSYRNDNSSLILHLPYETAEFRNNTKYFEEYYNDIVILNSAAKVHPKAAITLRNKAMVDEADLVIVYIERTHGGAYNAYKYALKTGKQIINLTPPPLFEKSGTKSFKTRVRSDRI